jgi:hypothetical protein
MTIEEKEKLKVWCTRVLVISGMVDGVDAIVERWAAEVKKAYSDGYDAAQADAERGMFG